MTTAWKPRLSPDTNLLALELNNTEGFLVSRLDGNTTPQELEVLTGMSAEQVTTLLERLVREGAVLAPEPVAQAAPDPFEAPLDEPLIPAETKAAEAGDPPDGAIAPGDEPDEDEPPEVDEREANATHLKLYREQFHPLPADERAACARTANGARLSALCFDPLPAVIHQLLQTPLASFEQARLIAAHHQNSAGLEWLINRPEMMRDAQVQRLLFRNPQLNEGQLRRLVLTKRLLQLWKLSVSREATSQTRAATVRLLRARFPTGSAEERVELIFSTEGRALAGLSGLSLDGKTVALLCARTYGSAMLVQNLARWSATPPALLLHLLKQPLVARQPRLKAMLQQHPNAPARARSL